MTEGNKIAILFPGQGSQYVGMGQEFIAADSEAAAMLAEAEEISKLPLKKLCMEGPMADLTRTAYLQPAMTVMNLIAWQQLEKTGISPDYMAGHSLGEYAALCAAGVLSFADTMALVTERGRLMEREADKNPGSMRAILGLEIDAVKDIIAGLASDAKICAANHNSAKQIVISGEVVALDAADKEVATAGGKSIPLKVSGAWHSELISAAVPDFTAVMAKIDFHKPVIPMFFNVTATCETAPDEIRSIMAQQIASTVRWYEIITKMIDAGVNTFIEVGPKTVLSGLLKKIAPKGYKYTTMQVGNPDGIAKYLAH